MKKINKLMFLILLLSGTIFSACNSNIVTDIISNPVAAKDRLDSANMQSSRRYPGSQLLMIFGKNVTYTGVNAGTTDISLVSTISDPNNIGAWIYVYKVPGTDTLAVYTPNPTPGARDCIELTSIFSTNTLIGLIRDTSAANIISGAISLFTSTGINISTNTDLILNSNVALDLAQSTDPVIKFNSSFVPSASNVNGSAFFSTGSSQSVNMFLIPAAGTLNLPAYISNLAGFPPDIWIVNFSKTNSSGSAETMTMGTVTQQAQVMGITGLTLTSKVINLSKFAL
ncbi:hypothetical protein BH10BAC5_BH10BAC5_15160 [soil metagenome]